MRTFDDGQNTKFELQFIVPEDPFRPTLVGFKATKENLIGDYDGSMLQLSMEQVDFSKQKDGRETWMERIGCFRDGNRVYLQSYLDKGTEIQLRDLWEESMAYFTQNDRSERIYICEGWRELQFREGLPFNIGESHLFEVSYLHVEADTITKTFGEKFVLPKALGRNDIEWDLYHEHILLQQESGSMHLTVSLVASCISLLLIS